MRDDLLGDVLYVDLRTGEARREPFTIDLLKGYIGGRGYSARLLWDMVKPGTDPLGPENVLIFSAGPLTGTAVPCSGRTSVTCKSPATGFYLKSNVGGGFGGDLKYSGYSHVVFTGCSEKPVYLWLDDEKVELRDASHLWGKDVLETTALMKEELGDPEIKVACIGPAGENLVSFAAIMTSNYNAAARGGPGAVMGSKRLKAIAVRGTKALGVACPVAFGQCLKDTWKALRTDSGVPRSHKYGTSGGIATLNELHLAPSYNFQQGYFEEADKIGGQQLIEGGYLKRRVACYSCPLGCHRYVEIDQGKYHGTFSGGPEYETVQALGSGCGVSNIEAIIKANSLCNRYGLDTISTGSVIQWLMECHQRGLSFDHDGLDLSWGNDEAVVELVKRIAFREGVGDLLAKGLKRAAEQMGQDSYKWAIQAKGLEQSRVETRSAYGYALAFAVNPRGPDHLMTETVAEFGLSPEAREVIRSITGSEEYANSHLIEKRAEIVRWHEDIYALTECLGMCVFTSTGKYFMNPERMAELLSAAVGEHFDAERLMALGRKIVTLEKCFNVREGATRHDDTLPWRLMHEEQRDLPGRDAINSPEKMSKMLDEYYALHGWDKETSWPTRDTLEALDLSDVADQLESIGKLP
ncbi:MAG: aldehyde ferredoxin oxidoreductase family protein [Chloroflexi bacterium]|nr:aldehyde ferredoxin oxidoreductase family protein [Chloroflexota bacterium]